MAFALVGVAGTASVGAVTTAVTPAYGQTPTAGNLLILFATATGSTNTMTSLITGWTQGIGTAGTGSACAAIYYRVATGGDTAPTIPAVTGSIIAAHLEEWSGQATVSPQDKLAGVNGITSPITATLNSLDVSSNELVAMAGADFRSAARATIDTWTSNNGTPVLRASNNGVSSTQHYSHATLITTANNNADTAVMTLSITLSITGLAVAAMSFEVAGVPAGVPFGRIPQYIQHLPQ